MEKNNDIFNNFESLDEQSEKNNFDEKDISDTEVIEEEVNTQVEDIDLFEEEMNEPSEELEDYVEFYPSDGDVNQFTLGNRAIGEDPRIPSTQDRAVGTITQFEKTEGGIDLKIDKKATTIHDKYKFQGTAIGGFVLSGDVLNAKVTVSTIKDITSTGVVFTDTGVISTTLREILVNAANERIDDVNGLRTESGFVDVSDRTQLALALGQVFSANDAVTTTALTVTPLTLTFKDLDAPVPKQVTLDFSSEVIFKTDLNYVRNIINEDSFVDNLPSKKTSVASISSHVNLAADGIAINFDFKASDQDKGLRTNTNYEFVAPNKDMLFFADSKTDTSVAYFLEGLNMTNFKTSRKLSIVETLTPSTATGVLSTATGLIFSDISLKDDAVADLDFNSVTENLYIDFTKVLPETAFSAALELTGTTIKFNTIKFYDEDGTINKMEVEDDRGDKYTAILSPIDSKDLSKGSNLQITGLERNTPYVFRKLHITAQPSSKLENKVILFGRSIEKATEKEVRMIDNNMNITTASFSEPELYIESKTGYVNLATGEFPADTSAGSGGSGGSGGGDTGGSGGGDTGGSGGGGTPPGLRATGEVDLTKFKLISVPVDEVTLPNGVKIAPVKNDSTGIRYVLQVKNPEGFIGNVKVNGLRGDEAADIKKYEDKKNKINYYILTIYNLIEDRDYGFLIVETSYRDPEGRELVSRQALKSINLIEKIAIGTTEKTIRQYPSERFDNTTEKTALTGLGAFNVTLFDPTLLEARRAEIPVFIDDIHGKFLRMEFDLPKENPDVKVVLEEGILKFNNLIPNSDIVYKIKFIYKGDNNEEQILAKYAKIKTSKIQPVDVNKEIISTTSTTATIDFTFYTEPKSRIIDVDVVDYDIDTKWNNLVNNLKLTGLEPDTQYSLEIVFRLENGLSSRHKITNFKTKAKDGWDEDEVKAFVVRVYEVALGREPESDGLAYWVSKLVDKEVSVTEFISNNLMRQDEFIEKNLTRDEFIITMYKLIVDREPESDGLAYWIGKYEEYAPLYTNIIDLRSKIAREMMDQPEFKEIVGNLRLRF